MVLTSTKKQIRKAIRRGNKKIKSSVSKKTYNTYLKVLQQFKKGKDTKRLFSKKGRYIPSRLKVHNKIIRKFLMMDKRTKTPDVYVLGGVAGSGKSRTLSRRIKEKAVIVNNDDIKKALAKYTPSPIRKYVLLHATLLHEESSDIEEKLLKKLLQQKKDVILDRTLANFNKNLKLLKKFKNKGYAITVLGTNLPPHIAIRRVTKRSIKRGRFVPLEVIGSKGNQTNRSVMKMAKQKFNKRAIVLDTRNVRRPKILYQKRYKKGFKTRKMKARKRTVKKRPIRCRTSVKRRKK